MNNNDSINYQELLEKIKLWATELGFADVGISDVDLKDHEAALQSWIDNGYHGEMDYMARHEMMRARPDELLPGTLRVISVRLDYLPTDACFAKVLKQPKHAFISRYALGRDYHKLMRNRLQKLGQKIEQYCQSLNYRPFVDSAPVLERPLAEKAGLGWVGKHTLLLNKGAGSWFFLGELLVDIPLPMDKPLENECGSCVACITICPTKAIVEPYVVDARRCISYLTIELRDAIPEEFRPLIGNRIYGCDDCQLICPWNRYAELSVEQDFQARNHFNDITLLELFAWTEPQFLEYTQGSPIRRIGFDCWQRNIAVALGNAPYDEDIVTALREKSETASSMVKEHIDWALAQMDDRQRQLDSKLNDRLTQRLIRTIEKGLPRDA